VAEHDAAVGRESAHRTQPLPHGETDGTKNAARPVSTHPKKTLSRRLRYVVAVARRFRPTLLLAAVFFLVLPWIYVLAYPAAGGGKIHFLRALHHVYFLLFGQPSLDYVDSWFIEGLNLFIPPFGLLAVVDGVVRFAYLFFAKHKADKEWIEVEADTMLNHVVVIGAGRVGFRVATQLIQMGKEVLVVERKETAAFVAQMRDNGVPVLIDDARNPKCLERINIKKACAIVCGTDDDLANINIGLDARKLNPQLRVVLRLFDEDLSERVRENFHAEAHSTSALAGHTLALSALDPRIGHSFSVAGERMVVSRFTVNATLSGVKVAQLRDQWGGLTISLKRGQEPERFHPLGEESFLEGDQLTVQCRYDEYLALRKHTGEDQPPITG
jgi:voltage-gated potassium channel